MTRKRSFLQIVLVSGLLALPACQEEAAEQETQPRPIAWATVEPVNENSVRRIAGVTRAAQRAPLSFEVPGTVETVAYEAGETFAEGDVLATLNTRKLKLALEERQSELAEAQATLVEAEGDLQRKTDLFNKGWVSSSTLDNAKSAHETAKSRVSLATARLRRAREDLQDATLKAPYDGVVAERLIEPSQQVSAGQTVFRVQGRDGGLEVEVTVPETIVNRLEIGTEHRVIPQIGDKPALTGEIVEIASQASERNAFPVTLSLQQPPAELRSGTTAEVRLSLTRESGPPAHQRIFEIPLTAYVPGAKGEPAHVFRFIEERGVVELTPVTIVEVEDAGAHVSEGLSAGDIIAAKGVAFLRDGQSVTLLGEGPNRFNP